MEALQRVDSNDAHYKEATFLLGLCRYYLSDFSAAEQSFLAVAGEIPLNEVWNNLGAAQSRKNSPEALENFKRALEGDANDPDYHFNVGYAFYKRGNFSAAVERFRAVLDRDPDDSEAILMLGRSLKDQSMVRGKSADLRGEGMERLKETYEESAYLQLKAVLEQKQ